MRAKAEQVDLGADTNTENSEGGVNIIEHRELTHELIHLDVSKYRPKKVQSIHKIVKRLGLWEEEAARAPPPKPDAPEIVWIPIEDASPNVFPLCKWETLGWAYSDQPDFAG